MTRDSFSSETPMSAEDISKSITTALPGVDASRAKGYSQLGTLRDAKARSLSREQTLLAQKHGGTTHPRIAVAQQRFTLNEQLRREIAVVNEITETPLPEADKDTLIVHGFVRRRSDHAGIPCLTLALTDTEGNWIKELGYACTDQHGYFLLEAPLRERKIAQEEKEPAADIKSPSDMNVEAAKREAEAKAAAAKQTAQAPAPATPADPKQTTPPSNVETKRTLQLRVFDAKGHVLHTESRPVIVRGGTVDYRYILLGDDTEDCACTPPPTKAGGRPATIGPKPADAPLKATMHPGKTEAPTQSRVGNLKAYRQPEAETLSQHRMPLEAIRGIGPKSADKLRGAGIKDVAQYSRTRGAELVKVSGFDKPRAKATPEPQAGQPPVAQPATEPAAKAKAPASHAHKPAAKKAKKKS